MHKAFAAFAAALVLVFASVASAQDAQGTSAPAASPPSPTLDFAEALMRDTGMVQNLCTTAGAQHLPAIREQWTQSDLYRNARPEHRTALLTFVEGAPAAFCQTIGPDIDLMAVRAAPHLSGITTDAQFSEAAAFMRTPEARAAWDELAQRVANNQGNGQVFPDWSATEAGRRFAQSDAGRALAANTDAINRAFFSELPPLFAGLEQRLRLYFIDGICNALGDECPGTMQHPT